MSPEPIYTASLLLSGATEIIREQSFTRWMSGDLLQASADFLRNIGLVPLYAECSPEGKFRYLLWHPPQGASFEVRSGRTKEQFVALDQASAEKGRRIIALHITEAGSYSATWISSDHFETATARLALFGITMADREE